MMNWCEIITLPIMAGVMLGLLAGIIIDGISGRDVHSVFGGFLAGIIMAGLTGYFLYSQEARIDSKRTQFVQQIRSRYRAGVELTPLRTDADGPHYLAVVDGEMCDHRRRSGDILPDCILFSFRDSGETVSYHSIPLSRLRLNHVELDGAPRARFTFHRPESRIPQNVGLQWALEEALDEVVIVCRPGECTVNPSAH